MKWLLLCLLFTGCSTTVYNTSGKPKFRTFADIDELVYKDKETLVQAKKLDHSSPTRAAGRTVTEGVMAVGATTFLK